jgi:uncharacterized protein YndB with AHSA1/START domain
MSEIALPTSDEAVRAATGRSWAEWFALLDEAGAASLDHKGIVARVGAEPGVSAWWQQSVTVAYERARGLRQKHQTTGGFEAGASKTIAAAPEAVFEAWHDDQRRAEWLPDPITIRKATPPKTLRITWQDQTHVDVGLYPKGPDKTQISLQHNKLADADEVARAMAFWAEALARLKTLLESGT